MLEKCNQIWEKVTNSMQREFDSEPVYNGKYLETKIKSYNGKINPNIGNNKIPNEVNPQVLLEECK